MKKRAFTLVELAITMTIIGLIIGGSFKAAKMMRERSKIYEAKENLRAAADAVIGYSLEYVDLPTIENFDENISTAQGNQKPLFYAVDGSLSVGDDICAFEHTNLRIVDDSGSSTHTIDDIAFVIATDSVNYNIQTAVDESTTPNEVHIYTPGTADIDDNPSDFTRPEEYDDIVKWVTLRELQQKVRCSDKPFRFINDRLPNAVVGQAYSATLYVENNITPVTISCTPVNDKGINFQGTFFSFDGNASGAGTSSRECSATEASPSARVINKRYVITIDPDNSSSGGGTTPPAACSTHSNQGQCVNAGCTWTGMGHWGSCS